MKPLQTLFLILFISCSTVDKKSIENKNVAVKDTVKFWNDKSKFHKLEKLFIVGDFDGDKNIDTLYQHNFSKLTQSEIDSSADPFQVEWDTVVKWFYNKDSDVFLSLNKPYTDTLHLGVGQGLFCLINLGDINKDGKDEIAFVIDKCDFTNSNTCHIYTICNKKWTLLNTIGVYESAFEFYSKNNKSPIFTEIKDYLEKQNGVWKYKNYPDEEYENIEDVGKLKLLRLEKCK